MSLYSFAAESLTTSGDLQRHPAIDGGQLARTLVLCACVLTLLMLAVSIRHGKLVLKPRPDAFQTVRASAATL